MPLAALLTIDAILSLEWLLLSLGLLKANSVAQGGDIMIETDLAERQLAAAQQSHALHLSAAQQR